MDKREQLKNLAWERDKKQLELEITITNLVKECYRLQNEFAKEPLDPRIEALIRGEG